MEYSLEPLFLINPILKRDGGKYILLKDMKFAGEVFSFLFNIDKEIYIDGFVSNKYKGEYFMLLPCIANEELSDGDVLIVPDVGDIPSLPEGIRVTALSKSEIICIQEAVLGKDVVVWGCGEFGRKAFEALEDAGGKVSYFVDADETKQGLSLYGRPVVSPEALKETDIVVEGVFAFQSVEEMIPKFIKRYRYNHEFRIGNKVSLRIASGIHMGINACANMNKLLQDRTCFLYIKEKNQKEEILHSFKRCGRKVDYVWEEEIQKKDVEFFREKNGFLLMDMQERQYAKALRDAGYISSKDMAFLQYFHTQKLHGILECSRDENLSFIASRTEKNPIAPGVYDFSNGEEYDYTVATVGSSLADPGIWDFVSWPEQLQRIFRENGYRVRVLSFGVVGYTSAQILLRIMRDVLDYKPDAIVTYDGANDMGVHGNPRYPFSNTYLDGLFQKLDKEVKDRWSEEKTYRGEEKADVFHNWLTLRRLTHAVASEFGIKYFSFFTPTLYCKNNRTIKDDMWCDIYAVYFPESAVNAPLFCRRLEEEHITENYPYIHDLTHIFDGKDVFLDYIHVNEEGNRIIAEQIYTIMMAR